MIVTLKKFFFPFTIRVKMTRLVTAVFPLTSFKPSLTDIYHAASKSRC